MHMLNIGLGLLMYLADVASPPHPPLAIALDIATVRQQPVQYEYLH